MSFALGAAAGSVITFVVFVAFMAPKHWDWYHQNVDLKSQLRVAVERAAHYQNLVRPNEWGTVAQHEAGIVTKEPPPWQNGDTVYVEDAPVEFRFDDIRLSAWDGEGEPLDTP